MEALRIREDYCWSERSSALGELGRRCLGWLLGLSRVEEEVELNREILSCIMSPDLTTGL